MLIISIVLGVATATPVPAASVKENFPRLSGIQIGKTPYDGYGDPKYQEAMAKLDLVLLGGSDRSINKHAKAIKDINPNILLAKYTVLTQVVTRETAYNTPLIRKLSSEKGPNNSSAPDWWLYDFDGEIVTGVSGGYTRTNLTEWVQPDSQGRRWPEFKAQHDYDFYMHDKVWDIWYSDVTNFRPKFQNRGFIGDYSGGKVKDETEWVAGWRRGHQAWWRAIRRLRPDIMIVVNHNWYRYQAPTRASGISRSTTNRSMVAC